VATRVLQIIGSLDFGGTTRQLTQLVKQLPADEFETHVCSLRQIATAPAVLRQNPTRFTTVNRTRSWDPSALIRLGENVRRLRPDIIHTWDFDANTYGRATALGFHRCHLIASDRRMAVAEGFHRRWIDRWLARYTQRIIVPNDHVRNHCLACGLPTSKLEVIRGGVPHRKQLKGHRKKLLHQLGIPPHARLIGASGPMTWDRRYKDLVWATEILKVIRKDVHLLIIGDGPQSSQLRRFRDQVQIQDRVHLLGDCDPDPILPILDCYWLGSSCESMPYELAEVMAAGVPVVATNLPTVHDLIVHGETGYLVQVGHRAGFSSWTNVLLNDSVLAQRIAEAGQKQALMRYNLQTMVNHHMALYRLLMRQTAENL